MKGWLPFVALVVALAAPAFASAQGVVVARFGGSRGAAVRRQIVTAIERAPGLSVISPSEAGGDPSTPAVLRELGARAYVEGRVGRVGRRWRARVRVLGSDGRELATETLGARRVGALTGVVRAWAREDLVPLLSSLEPAAPPSPAPRVQVAVEMDEDEADEAESAVSTPPPEAPLLPAPISIRAGVSVVNRSFTYNDDIFGVLSPYVLPAAPMVSIGVDWFPGGHVDLGVLSGLSVRAEGELAVGLESVDGDGVAYPTELWSLAFGLRWRVRVDDVELHVDGGYRGVVFTIGDAGEAQPRPAIPNVEIHAVRAGAGLRWDIGSGLFFAVQGAYLAPLVAGEIASEAWFPRASVGGVEGDVGLGLRIDDVELYAAFALRRFFYAMNPEPGDARIAGGAVDQYLSGLLELRWTPSQLRQAP